MPLLERSGEASGGNFVGSSGVVKVPGLVGNCAVEVALPGSK